jgi:hypothetical protein
MSLLKAILDSNYLKVTKSINEGANVNDTLNPRDPMTMLEVAIETNKENPSSESELIINFLVLNGAKTYKELIDAKPRGARNLPPLSVKGTVRGNIKTTGIAGLSRRGGRTRRSRSRKNRR